MINLERQEDKIGDKMKYNCIEKDKVRRALPFYWGSMYLTKFTDPRWVKAARRCELRKTTSQSKIQLKRLPKIFLTILYL